MENNIQHSQSAPAAPAGGARLLPALYASFLVLMALELIAGPMRPVGDFAATTLEYTFNFLLAVVLIVVVPISALVHKLSFSAGELFRWIPPGAWTVGIWLSLVVPVAALIIKTGLLRTKICHWIMRAVMLLAVTEASLTAYLLDRSMFAESMIVIFAAAILLRWRKRLRASFSMLLLPAGLCASLFTAVYFVAVNKYTHHPVPEGAKVIFQGGAYDAFPTGDGGYLVAAQDRHVYHVSGIGGKAEAFPELNNRSLLRFFSAPSENRVFLGQRLHNRWRNAPFLTEFKLPKGEMGAQLIAPMNFTVSHGAVDSARNRLYILPEFGSWLMQYDLKSLAYQKEIFFSRTRRYPELSCEVDVNHGTGVVYVTSCFFNSRIHRYDPEAGAEISRRGGGYIGMALDEERNIVYVARAFGGRVDVLDGSTLELLRVYPSEFGVRFLAIDPGGERLYATNFLTGSITVIDTAGSVKPRILSVGSAPRGIHYDPHAGGIVVSCAERVLFIPAK